MRHQKGKSTFHRALPNTRILAMPEPTVPAPLMEKREMYTLFAGRQICQLGHLFKSAHLAQHAKNGEHSHPNSKKGLFSMLHPDHPWINIHVTPTGQLENAWRSLMGYSMASLQIQATSRSPMYNVIANSPSSSGYVVGMLTAQDVDFIVSELRENEITAA